jgi:hypothetical protein
VLFSDPRVSSFIRSNFVAAWESVRPVPTVEIDFGNGRKLKRTVNGNIATCICDPTGRVLDVIPGLNTPEAYLESLRYALNLYRASLASFDKTVLEYHAANLETPTVYEWVRNDRAKAAIERLVRMSLDKRQELADQRAMGGLRIAPRPLAAADIAKNEIERPVKKLTDEERAILAADTETNRKERMPVIHKILSEKVVRPADITKRIYKEALHCDLEDPYLGLISGAFGGGAYENR